MLNTPVLVTAKTAEGPPEFKSVIAIPKPAEGVTEVSTRLALSNIELPRITLNGLVVAPKLAVPFGTREPFIFQLSIPLN